MFEVIVLTLWGNILFLLINTVWQRVWVYPEIICGDPNPYGNGMGDSAFGGDEVMRVCNWMSGVLIQDSKELAVLSHHVRTQWIVSMNGERVLIWAQA